MKDKITTEWIAGLTQEQQAEMRRLWKLSNPLLDRLNVVLQKRLTDLREISGQSYDRPGWAYWRADRDGQIRAIESILEILPDQR